MIRWVRQASRSNYISSRVRPLILQTFGQASWMVPGAWAQKQNGGGELVMDMAPSAPAPSTLQHYIAPLVATAAFLYHALLTTLPPTLPGSVVTTATWSLRRLRLRLRLRLRVRARARAAAAAAAAAAASSRACSSARSASSTWCSRRSTPSRTTSPPGGTIASSSRSCSR